MTLYDVIDEFLVQFYNEVSSGVDTRDATQKVVEKVEQLLEQQRELCSQKVADTFYECRFEEGIHLGLGDIRLSIGVQEGIVDAIKESKLTEVK